MSQRRSRHPMPLVVAVALSACGLASCGHRLNPHDGFSLKGGERIVFLGDSITQSGLYISYLDAYLRTRFPDQRFILLNHGLNGESISGNREAGSTTSRPNALHRFTRDVTLWQPQVVVAAFGMNDGCYRPFDPPRFDRFKNGIHTLVDRTRNEAHASLMLLTPPPFDPYRRQVRNDRAPDYCYDFPAIDYDETLKSYSHWLLSFEPETIRVADVHAAMTDHLKRRREGEVSFFLSDDAVHPNATGHWLIAQTILLAWRAPALVAEARINARTLQADSSAVRQIRRDGADLQAVWRTGLPMPLDPAWDPRSVELESLSERLNRYRLAVTGLTAPHYLLRARLADPQSHTHEESVAGPFSREQLAAGIDLTRLSNFPTVALAQQVLGLILELRSAQDARWRDLRTRTRAEIANSLALETDDLMNQRIQRLCQPRDIELRLSPFDTEGS